MPLGINIGNYTFRTEVVDTNSGSDIAWKTVNVQNNKPSVGISVSNTTITEGGSVTVTAIGSDVDGSINQISFFRDGLLQATDTTPPYTYTYNPAGVGTHRFQTSVVDNDGGTKNSSIVNVTVKPQSNADPVASLTTNSNPMRGETISITGNYTDADGNLSAATIRDLGSGDKSEDMGAYPSIDNAGVSISGGSDSIKRNFTIPLGTSYGPYTFRTEVVDSEGASNIVWAVINVGNSLPLITLSVPSTVFEGNSVPVEITATGSTSNINRVEIYRNGNKVANRSNLPTQFNYTNATLGTHYFHAVVFNEFNDSVTSNTDNVVVSLAPLVKISSSSSAISLDNSVTLDAEVGQGSVDRVEFYRGGSIVQTATVFPYSFTDTPNAAGTYSYFARAIFNNGSETDSNVIKVEVVDEENEIWSDFNNDGYLDQVLAVLEKPNSVGRSIFVNDIELTIEDQTFNVFEPSFPGYINIEQNHLATVRFFIQKGYQDKVQYRDLSDNLWINWSPSLPGGLNETRIVWCDVDELWAIWSDIPEFFRVIRLGRKSFSLNEPISEDVDGDGIDETAQEMSPEVYGQDDDELFIKVDCPENVIGCDEETTKLVINKDGQWIVADETQSIIREITTTDPSDPEYPLGGYSQNDHVIAVPKGLNLSFWFSEPSIIMEFIDNVPDYAKGSDGETGTDQSDDDSDNFFLRQNNDFKDINIYYRISNRVPVNDVRFYIFEEETQNRIQFGTIDYIEGEKDAEGNFKTGDHLQVIWADARDGNDFREIGFYRVQMEVFLVDQAEPIKTSIADADPNTPGWQCPDDGLVIHDLIWKHQPIIYLGTGEVVGPPQHPFNTFNSLWMRHRNSPHKTDPVNDPNELWPHFDSFGTLSGVDYESFLAQSIDTTNPYVDIDDSSVRNNLTSAVLFYHSPLNIDGSLIHLNYAFIQYWMYMPSSHSVYNADGIASSVLTHEGDWEMCQFTLRIKNPDNPSKKKYWIEPFAATASRHYYGQTILWDRKIPHQGKTDQDYVTHKDNGNRVNLYIAENSHATYFRSGIIDSGIFAGAGTQVQYNSLAGSGFDRITPDSSPTETALQALTTSNLFIWNGRWGQTYTFTLVGIPLIEFEGPSSPRNRFNGINTYDSTQQIIMARDPIKFHDKNIKETLSTQLKLR